MEKKKAILAAGLACGFCAFAWPAFADHDPENPAENVFFEMENFVCQQEADCFFPKYSDAYKACMLDALESDFSSQDLERIFHFKKRNGYFSKADLEAYHAIGFDRGMQACER